jgi:xylulokinase
MSIKYLIGIDLGTTLAKCGIYDESGVVLSEANQEMVIEYPSPGEAIQDANQFYTVSCNLIKKCIKNSKINTKRIVGISIDSQMGGIMSIDRNFEPVTYYDTPLDCRSSFENKYMHTNYGDLILEKNGSFSTYGNKILYWKKKSQWKDIYKFIQPSAFVAGKLAGLSGNDAYMDDSFICYSGLADLKKSEWSQELCELLEVDIEKLPTIIKSTEIIGEISKKASEDTNIPQGVPISAGCGDTAAGFIGAGIVNNGQMVDVSGTACVLGACINDYKYDIKNKTLACMKSAIGNNYYLMSCVLGGRTHKWFVDEFFSEDKKKINKSISNIYNSLDMTVKDIKPGSEGLISINHLHGRFFPPDPYMRGLFIGYTWAHKKIHFYRSILESIAYDNYLTKKILKEMVKELKLEVITSIGSGSNSELWMQIKADVLQIPYQNLLRSDLTTLGSAIIAGYSAGLFSDIRDILRRVVKIKRKIIPILGKDKEYIKYIEIYKELLNKLSDIYKKISL